jgi:hypothetical protein
MSGVVEDAMKFAAHPLVVAVALGLIDATVLEGEAPEADEAPVSPDLGQSSPSPEDFAQIELAWQSVRGLY